MRDHFRNYDAWLEAPYQRAAAEAEELEKVTETLTELLGRAPTDVEVSNYVRELEADYLVEAHWIDVEEYD